MMLYHDQQGELPRSYQIDSGYMSSFTSKSRVSIPLKTSVKVPRWGGGGKATEADALLRRRLLQ